jgi:hypothetical protein
MLGDGRGRSVALALAPRQANELPMVPGPRDCGAWVERVIALG